MEIYKMEEEINKYLEQGIEELTNCQKFVNLWSHNHNVLFLNEKKLMNLGLITNEVNTILRI